MTKPTIYMVDVATQEEVIREMNDAEYAQHLLDVEAEAARNAE